MIEAMKMEYLGGRFDSEWEIGQMMTGIWF
jgi:hypothetical protein